ncbi:hypothetical protein TUST1-182_01115 [Vibrio phage ICP1_2006_C]|nr:hypothetical protein TUST1-191_01115 [Vibrio phage ICP1_2006_D]ADX88496.1 hypothetical protein TUST1-182_01115 [Vibrio phage ICP1_2006_C]ADX88720.1 hypothetical protein TUST1-159_01100 [Vibrio phage ICP1_2006_B]ADX88946.1 hypothetical protein TUST1-17_01100 [Vibrio phage ICP1_2006_A]ADX89406.1 hypothetical protein TUST1-2_01130 [Vibrio phage ICP1_2001_A]APD17917.1 hypothetical protein [Vibrio phage JSF4]ASV41541.1 hypothetical protein [Vibrio phage JSF6]
MTTYNTYAEAKIANPDSEIYVSARGFFAPLNLNIPACNSNAWVECHPKDYCITLEEFLKKGYKLVDNDIYPEDDGDFCVVGVDIKTKTANSSCVDDEYRYILRAKALETQPTKSKIDNTPQQVESLSSATTTNAPAKVVTKVEYEQVKVKSFFELSEPFQLGELYFDAAGDCEKKSKILTELQLSQLFFRNTKIYRRIEKELTWQEYVESIYSFVEFSTKNKSVHINTKQSIDEDSYLEMCRVTLRAIGEIE